IQSNHIDHIKRTVLIDSPLIYEIKNILGAHGVIVILNVFQKNVFEHFNLKITIPVAKESRDGHNLPCTCLLNEVVLLHRWRIRVYEENMDSIDCIHRHRASAYGVW